MSRVLATLSLLLALVVLASVAPVAPVAPVARAAASAAPAAAPAWSGYDRPATFTTTEDRDVAVTMSDGVVLRANVMRPDDTGRHPVLLIQTPYNKDGAVGAAFSSQSQYFVQRGYAVATVDVRGTGSSQGTWDSFGPAEQRDGYELVEWAASQAWSDGDVGLFGASYMGLNQLYTAAQRPPGLKAIFPIVPMVDGYRDIVFSGGDLNASFIPLWLGLVAVGSFQPSQDAVQSGDPTRLVDGLTTVLQHVAGSIGFDVPTVIGSATGGDTAYDGPFWKTRSPLEVVDTIDVPAFVVGGHHDLFQRGEPLIYERLKQRVPARLLMGPWTHVDAASGAGLPADGVPALDAIALRWFDRYLMGVDTKVGRIPKVTQYVYGDERWETQADYPDPGLTPQRMYLRGGRALSAAPPSEGEAPQTFLQQPLSGICTQSTSQWTAGLGQALPCATDNRADEALGTAVYTTAPMADDDVLSGPVLANLWVTTTASDAAVTVRLTDVDPSGASKELTTGWLAASMRAVNASRSRYVNGELMQPWHPFTRESVEPVAAGVPMQLAVEVFPVRATIKAGHALRVTVAPSDFPHQVPPVPQLLAGLGGQVSVLTDPAHPSSVTLPGISDCSATGCAALPVPNLLRG
jgi:putative CocE/NonD family hydrolase